MQRPLIYSIILAGLWTPAALAVDVVRPIGEGQPIIAPVIETKQIPALETTPAIGAIPQLAVPSAGAIVPETLSPQAQTPETAEPSAQPAAPAPVARQTLEQAGQPIVPQGADQDPAAGVEISREIFDHQAKLSVVHVHSDDNGDAGQVHFESYRHGHGQQDAPPMDIPARLEPYLPSARDKNPQDWTAKITLHLHSIFSDGTMTPEDVMDAAYKKGVRIVALTDHDTAAGVERAWKKVQEISAANPGDPVEFHTGIEMTARGGAHIGAVDVDLSNPKLIALLERVRIARYKKAEGMIANLNALDDLKEKGIVLTIEEVKAFSQHDAGGTIEIPHIARALLAHGLIQHVDDAYDKYLKGDVFSVPGVEPDPTAQEVVETVHAAGGKAFLNHPYTVRGNSDAEKDTAVEAMLALGMDGIEVYRPSHATSDIGKRQADERAAKYLLWAEKYNLMPGNGADFHGMDTHLDQLTVWMHNKMADQLKDGLKQANGIAMASLNGGTMKPPAPEGAFRGLALLGLAATPTSQSHPLLTLLAWALAGAALLWLSYAPVLSRLRPAPARVRK
jgi:hypothetical protein